MIGDEAEGGNFLDPKLDDESENWVARDGLLEKYRNLLVVLKNN